MADVPLSRAPRTVTVRVRSLAVAGTLALAVGLVWWAGAWASGMQPLRWGALDTSPRGLTFVPHTRDAMDTGPAVLEWRRGGRFVVTLWLHNSASVPVTVTGADHTPGYWLGILTGPALAKANEYSPGDTRGPFRPVTIPADGERAVAFVFRPNPRACGNDGPGGTERVDGITVHFTTLGVVHDSQTIPLGDSAVVMAAPSAAACAR